MIFMIALQPNFITLLTLLIMIWLYVLLSHATWGLQVEGSFNGTLAQSIQSIDAGRIFILWLSELCTKELYWLSKWGLVSIASKITKINKTSEVESRGEFWVQVIFCCSFTGRNSMMFKRSVHVVMVSRNYRCSLPPLECSERSKSMQHYQNNTGSKYWYENNQRTKG